MQFYLTLIFSDINRSFNIIPIIAKHFLFVIKHVSYFHYKFCHEKLVTLLFNVTVALCSAEYKTGRMFDMSFICTDMFQIASFLQISLSFYRHGNGRSH